MILLTTQSIFIVYVCILLPWCSGYNLYFLACHQNTSVGDRRRLLVSSIVFFHSTLSVGCRYLGGLPYTVLVFGEGCVAFMLQ